MGNSFVLFDVSIVISHGQFHCGNRGHTQNADFPWVKSHFPVGKKSSGTTAIAQLSQLFQPLHLAHIYGHGFYDVSRMLLSKNVNNDVSKDSPNNAHRYNACSSLTWLNCIQLQ